MRNCADSSYYWVPALPVGQNLSLAALSSHDLIQIEHLCDRFESESASGPRGIAAVLRSSEILSHQHTLLLELLKIDFERRIRSGAMPALGSLTCEYRPHLIELFDEVVFREALKVEFEMRSRWGDRPTISQFRSWVGKECPVDGACLHRILQDIFPMVATVFINFAPRLDFELSQPVVMGRKKYTDPPPLSFSENDGNGESRLIVTRERRVSRRQLLIDRPSADSLRIVNLGSGLPVQVNLRHEVRSGEIYESSDISHVTFFNVTLRIRRPSVEESREIEGFHRRD